MTSVSNEQIHTNIPIVDVKNYNMLCKQMKVMFGYKNILKVIKNGVTPLVEGVTKEQLIYT